MTREAGTARSWGLERRLRLGIAGSRQGEVICRWGHIQVARECKWRLLCVFLIKRLRRHGGPGMGL